MTDLSIISPEKFTVGFKKDYDLAFATYKDKKGKLHKEVSFNKWISQQIPIKEFDNVPTKGFKVHSLTQRSSYWFGSGRHVWRIEDPRGFVLEISSENMQGIIGTTLLKEGLIDSPCVWVWSGQYLSLIPTCSNLYKDVIANNERVSKKISKKDVKIGNRVLLKNGTEGIYYGKWWVLQSKYSGACIRQVEILKPKDDYWLIRSEFQISEIKDFSENLKLADDLHKEIIENKLNDGILKISKKSMKISDFYREEDLTEEDYNKINFEFDEPKDYKERRTEHLFTVKIESGEILPLMKYHPEKRPYSNDAYGYLYFCGLQVVKSTDKYFETESLPNNSQNGSFYYHKIFSNQTRYGSIMFTSNKLLQDWFKQRNPKKVYLNVDGVKINL